MSLLTKVIKTRDGVYDSEILAQVSGGEYFPKHIDFSALQTVIDIGGHIGTFVAYVKERAPECQIWSIELDADNYALLCENTAQWQGVNAIHAYCSYAAYDSYSRHKENYGNISLVKDFASEPHDTITTLPPRITLESLTAPYQSVDLLKLDCEGSEQDILMNANLKTLAKFTWIVGEYHPAFGVDFQQIAARLTDFEVVVLQPAKDWGHFLLRNKSK